MSLRSKNPDFGCIINVNKPVGKSSFAVVSFVRKLSGLKKVGHAGTLDPQADGVLLIVMGKATRRVEELMNLDKEYNGTVRFGHVTDTYDSSGTLLTESPTDGLSRSEIESLLPRFTGKIQQVPPVYSALKHKGRPLYSYARKGIDIKPPPRSVTVHDITLESFKSPDAVIRVICSRGTYIRSIAHDMGQMLGCGAVLSSLTRTRVGDYHLNDAVSWNDLPGKVKKIIADRPWN